MRKSLRNIRPRAFTEQAIELMREMRKDGWKISEIARYFGRPEASITNVFRRWL